MGSTRMLCFRRPHAAPAPPPLDHAQLAHAVAGVKRGLLRKIGASRHGSAPPRGFLASTGAAVRPGRRRPAAWPRRGRPVAAAPAGPQPAPAPKRHTRWPGRLEIDEWDRYATLSSHRYTDSTRM